METTTRAFLDLPVHSCETGTATIAYRTVGTGPPLLLLHGYPLWSFTFRQIIPYLAPHFTCYLPDTPGAGETRWGDRTDFHFAGQAHTLVRFVDGLQLSSFTLLGQDTGGTIARQVALLLGERVHKLVLIGTEIPHHRPRWIPVYQRITALPGSSWSFARLLRSRAFVRSRLGFGDLFVNKALLAGDFVEYIIAPLCTSAQRLQGQLRYLRGIDWRLVDGLAARHREIRCPVLLIWGEQDRIFPVHQAATMLAQFADGRGLAVIPGAKLLVHEEQPEAVARCILNFCQAD